MPGIYYETMNRKQFMVTAMGAIGTATMGQVVPAQPATEKSFRVAVLSDTHIPANMVDAYREFRPYDNLKTVIPQVVASKCECAVINGDAARLTGEIGDYEVLKGLLKSVAEKMPIYIGLGNHDHRKNFYRVFGKKQELDQGVAGKHTLVVESNVVRIIVLDSLLYVDRVAGLLGKAQRDWLEQYLATTDSRPTVLFVHHTLSDSDGSLLDVDRLFNIIKPYRQVKAIFYGHSHRYLVHERDGVHLVNLPAVGYNFNDNEPVGWIEAEFTEGGVAMKLFAIGGNLDGNGNTTKVNWV